MNDRDASRHAGELPVDPAQADRLDRYLDGLVGGDHRPEPGLDPTLAATARAAQGPTGADPDGTAVDRSWRDLMAQRPRPQLRTLPASSRPTTLASPETDGRGTDLSPSPSPARIVAQRLKPRRLLTARSGGQTLAASTRTSQANPSGQWRDERVGWTDAALRPGAPVSRAGRVRAFGDRTMGLVATLALVAVIVLSGTAVWLNAPRSAGPPPTFLAGISSTPSATEPVAVWATPGVNPVVGVVPADAIRPIVQPCTVTPRTIEDVITVLGLPYREQEVDAALAPLGIDPFRDRPFLLPESTNPSGDLIGARNGPLPAGAPIDRATVETLAALYGQFIGCGPMVADQRLALEALRSDDALIRFYWASDQAPYGSLLIGLGLPPNPPDTTAARDVRRGVDPAYLPTPGEAWRVWLWGFRTLPDGRVAAYVAQNQSPDPVDYWGFRLMPDGRAAAWVSPDQGPVPTPAPATAADGEAGTSGYLVFAFVDGRWLIDEQSGPGQG